MGTYYRHTNVLVNTADEAETMNIDSVKLTVRREPSCGQPFQTRFPV